MSLCHITSRATALAILAEENGIRLSSERNKNPIPLHLLVKEMPGEIYIYTPITAMPSTLHEHCMLVYLTLLASYELGKFVSLMQI